MRPRTLEVLAVLVVALAVGVLVDRPAPSVPLPDRLFPGMVASHVAEVRILRGGTVETVLARAGGAVTVNQRPADDDAVTEFLGTLEYLAFRRRVPSATPSSSGSRGLDPARLILQIADTDGARHELRVGAAEPLLGRTWVTLGDGFDDLVDDYAVRALDRRPEDLLRRNLFGARATAPAKIVLAASGRELRLDGTPACVEVQGGCAAADRARAAALRSRLADLALTRFLPAAPADAVSIRVAVDGAWLAATDAHCPGAPDERQVTSTLGAGCLAAAALAEIGRDVVPPEAWIDVSPLLLAGADVDRVDAGALVLERVGGGWRRRGGGPVDGEAVRGWLSGLASFRGKVVALPRGPLPAPAATIAAGDTVETLTLLPGAPGGAALLRRGDEPVALAVHPGVRALLAADPTLFADRSVLSFEPSALAEVVAEGPGALVEHAVRGATGESFALTQPVPVTVDIARLAELRDVASHLRAVRVVALDRARAGLAPPRRRVAFLTNPPVGEDVPGRQVVELGASGGDGTCFAARPGADTIYVLAAAACATLEAPLASLRVFELAPDDATEISAFGATAERHGGFWYAPDGARLDGTAAGGLTALVRLLAVAPAVTGYGPLAGGTPVVFTGPKGSTALHVGRGEYALDGRPVRYRVPDEVCRRVPAACK